ncbi:PAS domain S-box protein [Geomonas sp.]|uniref:PAS domain S-box protein n=1 Tax=Geomonas sp. TaxID=2651584 RepID=UPI002B4721D4|nr:PAS domain S-box protein [Geomonas sp.]HJV35330.1 PAS domain S-box protein [Geomonas sp.]
MTHQPKDQVLSLQKELAALRLEKENLSQQVKRLVQAEGKLYAYQEQLDAQLKEYQELYELNKRLNGSFDLPAVLSQACSYVIETLGYERVIFLRRSPSSENYAVCALDGYYDEPVREAVCQLVIPAESPLLEPLFAGEEFRICWAGCDDAELAAFRQKVQMEEFLLYRLGPELAPFAVLVLGNSAENASFYRRVTPSASLPGVGNLVGLLSSTIENQLLYASMERALEQERLAQQKYRGIFENSIEGIYQTTPEGRFLSCNPAIAAILGYGSPQEVIDSITDIRNQLYVDPERRDRFLALLKSGQEVKDFEARLRCRDGSIQWIRMSGHPLFDEQGKLTHIDGTMQNITRQKEIEEALSKLSLAVEQSPVTIVITDTRGLIEFVNPKFEQLTGYGRREVIGKTLAFLKSEHNPPEMYRKLWETLKSGNIWEGEFVNRKKNGELFSERATISPIKNREGVITHYLAIKEDITERKQLEAQLLQSQKMESVGRLAGGVAHDFNNMLSVIIGCAQLAMLKVTEGDQLWQFLNQISRAAERSSEITRQLLAFSRKELISLKKVNLNAKVVETQNTLGRLIGEDINLTFKPAPGLWAIEADPSQLDQILVNLAVNARDAMPGGGQLAIETANVHIDHTYCKYHLDARPGDYVQLTVSDSGTGMDRDTLAHIFEPFFTTKGVGKGTGLGLATVYGIVRQNNGFVTVYSEPGHGTSFRIHFPKSQGEVEAEELAPETTMSGSGNVLLVEDDPLVREMASQMLAEIGYTVIQTRSPEDAIEICRKGESRIDLVLTDVVMPGMNGKEMVDEILTFSPGMKVLFMSGYTSDLVAQRGVMDEGRHFIQKPFDLHSLNEKIKEALAD